MEATKSRRAQIHFTKGEGRPKVEVLVPKNMNAKEIAKLNELLVNKVLPGITGHPCYSGADMVIREQLGEIIAFDVDAGVVIG
jgi:hypothetical protein